MFKNIKPTKTYFYKENEQLTYAGNILKGYVKSLRKKTLIGLGKKENIINKKLTKRKNYFSSKNLEIKNEIKRIKKEKKTNKRRRLSYTIDNSGILNISPRTKLRKINSLRPEIVFEFNNSKTKYHTPKKNLTSKSIKSKGNFPVKSYSNNIKILNEKINFSQKKKIQEKNELFSFLKKPQYFKGENNDSNSIILDNKPFSLTGISNKNILQLNEIRKELKDTFLGKTNILQQLSKKSFIIDDIEKNESPEINYNIYF